MKDGFSGLGPISDEGDRVTLVRLYLLGLSYAMGVVPRGEMAVGELWRSTKRVDGTGRDDEVLDGAGRCRLVSAARGLRSIAVCKSFFLTLFCPFIGDRWHAWDWR